MQEQSCGNFNETSKCIFSLHWCPGYCLNKFCHLKEGVNNEDQLRYDCNVGSDGTPDEKVFGPIRTQDLENNDKKGKAKLKRIKNVELHVTLLYFLYGVHG